jgi:hypothetical protein
MTWPQSFCPQCGTEYYGWAFGNPACQICSKCGARLVVGTGRLVVETEIEPVSSNLDNPGEDDAQSESALTVESRNTKM